MSDRILLVEDDAKLGEQVVSGLEEHAFEVTWCRCGDEAVRMDMQSFELVILDLMLPGRSGYEVLKSLRDQCGVPVLILSAKSERVDVVRALMLGADDYLKKPFWPEELTARVHARLRRPSLQGDRQWTFESLSVDVDKERACVDGDDLFLTRVEFQILAALVRREGQTLTRRWIVERVLDSDSSGSERTLDVHVSRLRKKLGAYGRLIQTVWRTGYRLQRDGA